MGTWTNRSQGLDNRFKWWETSTIADSDITAVYQPLGANSVAISYRNLISPGISDASPTIAPDFSKTTGWEFTGTQHLTTGITGNGLQTVICRIKNISSNRNTVTGYVAGGRSAIIETRRDSDTDFLFFRRYNITGASAIETANNTFDLVLCLARNQPYFDGTSLAVVGALDTWSEGAWLIADDLVGGSGKFEGEMLAWALYNKQLSATEVSEVTANMQSLTSNNNPSSGLDVNWIVQNPATKRLNSTSHELWIATNGGIFRTLDGGRGWAQITLPDPSNAEFVDSPAATVDELTFHWIDYDPTDELTLYVYAAKPPLSRIWAYKTTDLGLSWTSRGVLTT